MKVKVLLFSSIILHLFFGFSDLFCPKQDNRQNIITWERKKGNTENLLGSWILTSYKKNKKLRKELKKYKVDITFSKTMVSGSTGCNSYSFPIKEIACKFLIVGSGIEVTERACEEQERMDVEETYLMLLGQAKSFTVYKDKLIIYCASKNMLIFKRSKPSLD